MYLSSTPSTSPWPTSPRGVAGLFAASAVAWAVAAALLYVLVPGLETLPRLLVFSECVGLTMVACVLLLRRQRGLGRLTARMRWLVTGLVAIPTGYLLGHQIAFLLLGEPMRLVGNSAISVVPILFTVLVGALGLRHLAGRERLAREAAAREQAQRLALEAQLRLLRAQLEPHMLFNTLANLRGLLREDIGRAETMIDRLIVYLRGTLAASQTEAQPLGREFAQLRAYLDIMSLRMGARLSWQLDLPAALQDCAVPTMLLQPLVENAIKHGLEPKVGPGRLVVAARALDGGIAIRVEDDGLGLPEGDPQAPPPDGGYGLRHVRERLLALYGPAARLDLAARAGGGLCATVWLPLNPTGAHA